MPVNKSAASELEALRKAPFFSSMNDEQRTRIARASKVVPLKSGENLWREGEPARHLGLVLMGRLKLMRGNGARGALIDVAVPNDVLGELAFALKANYQSSATCLRKARVLLIPGQLVREVLGSDPEALNGLVMDLAQQFLRMVRAVEDLSAGTVERRLARVLLRLCERAGEPFPGGMLIPMKLRRQDLAAIAATTLESTSRKISEWNRRGWVVPQPAGYLIKDTEALRRLVEGEDPPK